MLATTGGSGRPASTRSISSRARSSSPSRKKARASSRRTRTSSGPSRRMARSTSMALSSSAFRSSSSSRRSAAPMEARPVRNRMSSRSGRSRSSGSRMESAASNCPFVTSARARATVGSVDRCESAAAVSERQRRKATISARNGGLMVGMSNPSGAGARAWGKVGGSISVADAPGVRPRLRLVRTA